MPSDLSSNHFELFALPTSFSVEQGLLSARYRELQQATHPDRFASAPDQERRLALQRAAQVNEAYQVLKDPLRRAIYLLSLRGLEWNDEQDTVVDTEFLMAQMERREALSEVRATTDPLDQVGRILDGVGTDIRVMTEQLASRLLETDAAALAQAKDLVRRMQFLYKLRHEAQELEAELEDER